MRGESMMRLHRYLLAAAVTAFVLSTAIAVPQEASDGARGRIVITSHNEFGLELDDGAQDLGSKLEVLYVTPDGDEIPYGFGCIDNIRRSLRSASPKDRVWMITARPVHMAQQPTVGLTVRIIPLQGTARIAWLEEAANKGCRGAKVRLANHYQYGWDVEQNWHRAFSLVRDAAEKDHFEARRELASMLDSRVTRMSFDDPTRESMSREAFQVYLALAQEGDIFSYRVVADKYTFGLGTEPNELEAEKWRRLAAENPPFKDSTR
jgi:TPR repeat protein